MNPSVGRILDANANRAREALRVIEDYARFVLNDAAICGELKSLRHELVDTLKPFLADAILYRDSLHDVGTTIKTGAELSRSDLSHVVIAAGKRLGEALRVLEEVTKTMQPLAASRIETLRYRFYAIEQQISQTFPSSLAERFAREVKLYVLITESVCRHPWQHVAREAIAGGADCLQLREKEIDAGDFLNRAREFVAICREGKVISIINDRIDIACLSDADGVHVGQTDLPCAEVRKFIGREKLIGVSTHAIEQAKRARLDGADYIGVGPVFPSSTKPRDLLPGLDYARQVAAGLPDFPAVAIAGITGRKIDEVLLTGMRKIAVASAVTEHDNPREAARLLRSKLEV